MIIWFVSWLSSIELNKASCVRACINQIDSTKWIKVYPKESFDLETNYIINIILFSISYYSSGWTKSIIYNFWLFCFMYH